MSGLDLVFGHWLVLVVFRVLALALLAGVVTTGAAFVYRFRTGRTLPEGATLLIGLGVVAIALNTRLVFVQFVGEGSDPLSLGEAASTLAVFVAAAVASYAGRRAGGRFATSERVTSGRLQPDLSPLVRAVGRFITVRLPEDIRDIDGYDPVDERTKTALAGKSLDFPRGMTVAQLESQLTSRLREEYDIGYVDLELTADGEIEYLAVGQRAAGLGPTLPPRSAAVAVRSDPPFSATSGDTVQLWRVDDGAETRVGVAELRASVGGVATVVTGESVARAIDPAVQYRLVTLAADAHPEREFAAMLRREHETMSVVELAEGGPLVGADVGSLAVTVIAVQPAGGEIETIPGRDRVLQAGDRLFAIGRPDALRRLETTSQVTPTAVSGRPATVDWTGEEPTVETPAEAAVTPGESPDLTETPER